MRDMFRRILIILVVVLGLLTAGLVFFSQQTRQLTGVVRDEATQLPIEGAQLAAAGYNATTNAQGRYSIALSRGKSVLAVQADGYEPVHIEVNGDALFTQSFSLELLLALNRVSVSVLDAETRQPLPKVQVQVGDQVMMTNAQGVFEAHGVKNGAAFVAQVPAYEPATVAFNGESSIEMALLPNAVNVSVSDKYTSQPIANAQIQAGAQSATGDAQGRAVFRRVKPGVVVRASASGYETASAPFGGSDIQLALRPNTLDGVVTDAATGQPISGTLVYLGNTIVTTDAQGVYHLDNVPAQASLNFKVPGYRKTGVDVSGVTRRDVKLTPFLVKGIRIPFGAAPERVRELMSLVGKTELNAVVIDVKSEKGRVAWDSQVPLAKQIGAAHLDGIDLTEVIERCRTQNIYCIARLPVFQDTLLATSRPSLAIRYTNGAVFMENNSAAWLNPYNTDGWNYNIALAKEIAALGFDEIQFDYIRFPGRFSNIDFGTQNTEEKRIAAIAGFLARAQKELRPTGVFISVDVFGLTTATEDDQHTGQRLRDLGAYVDYVCPMVYPDTWVEATDLLTKGLGLTNCTEAVRCPYDVVYNSYKHATEKTSTKIRLWLQAYAGRGDFGLAQYKIQKKAATDAGSYGWMFWNGQGIYDPKLFDGK
jgi:hypothetical protein